jgi:hypothetical protein
MSLDEWRILLWVEALGEDYEDLAGESPFSISNCQCWLLILLLLKCILSCYFS